MKRIFALLLAFFLLAINMPSVTAANYDPDHPEILAEGHLSAQAAILIEADTGNVIFEKNADQRMYPASITKIMTCWLALNSLTPEQLEMKVQVSDNAVNLASDESTAKFASGEEVRIIDLIYAAILVSGNDAATAIAEGLSGSVSAFVEIMNFAAASLGCQDTHFVNANGLHDENHYSTARDLAIIARVAMQNETFRKVVSTTSYVLPRDNIYRSRSLTTGIKFLLPVETKYYYEWATGMKTGTTSAAGKCFVASASRDGVNLIAVVLGAENDGDRYTDAKKLLEYGFTQYISTSIREIYLMNPRVVEVMRFAISDPEVGRLELGIRKVDESQSDIVVTTQSQVDYWIQNFNNITVTEFTRELKAPITAGEVMGTLTYLADDGSEPVVYELLATRSIEARILPYKTLEEIRQEAENDPNPFPRLTFEIVFLYLVLPLVLILLTIQLIRFVVGKIHIHRRLKTTHETERFY